MPRQGCQRVEEGVEVVGVDHDRRPQQQLGQGVGERLGQVGEQHVVALDQHQRGGRPPDRCDEVPAPAAVVDLGEDLERADRVVAAGEVGRHPRRRELSETEATPAPGTSVTPAATAARRAGTRRSP